MTPLAVVAVALVAQVDAGVEGDSPAAPSAEEAAREADMFGGDVAPSVDDAPSTSGDREADMFGGASVESTPSSSFAGGLMDVADDILDVGGLLYLRLDGTVVDEDEWYESRLSSSNFFDLYLDARPNDRVRGFASFRVAYDPTIDPTVPNAFGQLQDDLTLQLDQLWIKGDIAHLAFVTAGRQHIKWGAARFWNPTDFMNRTTRNPLETFDRRLGVDALKLHVPFEQLGWNFYFLTALDDVTQPWMATGAARAEIAFWTSEVTMSAAFHGDRSVQVGADLSTGIWLFDLRAEGAASYGETRPYYVGELDIDAVKLPKPIDVSDEWILRGVVGADVTIPYSDQDQLIVGLEYFYNSAGYADRDLYPWLLFQGAYTPLYVGQHYAAAYASAFGPGSWNDTSFTLSAIGNLSDQTYLARLDCSQLVLTYITLNAYAAAHLGDPGGELRFGLDVDPIPFIAGLENGFHVPTPDLDVGVGARVAF